METTYYEVRCENCRTSFPPEAKRCIHCGGPLGGGLAALFRQGGGPRETAVAEAEPDEEVIQVPGRSVLWVLTAILAIGISMLRACMGGN